MPDTLTCSVPEAAELVGVSERTLRYLVANGDLPTLKIGSARRVSRHELQLWVDKGGVYVARPGGVIRAEPPPWP